MAPSTETQIKDMIQTQMQELQRLNDEVQRLKQLYDVEKKQRRSLEKKCKELEDIIKNERIPSNYPPAIKNPSGQDSNHTSQGLEYPQYLEGQNTMIHPNQYHSYSERRDDPATYYHRQPPNYPAAAPLQQDLYAAPRQPNPYPQQANNSNFIGGFKPLHRKY